MGIDASSWLRMPVDDVGYYDWSILSGMSDSEVIEWARRFERRRYGGWRNVRDAWVENLILPVNEWARVMDFGCGFGIEALQFAKRGCEVVLCDIHEANTLAALRVLTAHGFSAEVVHGQQEPPFFGALRPVDIFYSNGVLHHTPHASAILDRAHEAAFLGGGEVRLMLYSDRAWLKKVGEPLPGIDDDVSQDPRFERFTRSMDGSGVYADWYSREKVEARLCGKFELASYEYIAEGDIYCAVKLEAT